jgi:hypothetical protein
VDIPNIPDTPEDTQKAEEGFGASDKKTAAVAGAGRYVQVSLKSPDKM